MKYIIISVFAILLIAACNTPTGTSQTGTKDELHGKWTMTSYVAFMPAIPELTTGDVVWDFNSNKKSLTVTKKDAEKHRVAGMPAGTYTYSVKDGIVLINGSDFAYTLKDGKLTLNSNTDPRLSSDGPVIQFVGMR